MENHLKRQSPGIIAVALDAHQAQLICAHANAEAIILCASPDGAELARSCSRYVLEVEDFIDPEMHGMNLRRVEDILAEIRQSLTSENFDMPVVDAIGILMFTVLPGLVLMDSVLRQLDADTFLTVGTDGSLETGDLSKSLLRCAVWFAQNYEALVPARIYGSFHGLLCIFANRVISRSLAKRDYILQLDKPTPFTRRMADMISEGQETFKLSARPPGKTPLATARRALKSLYSIARCDTKAEIRVFRATSNGPATEVTVPVLVGSDPLLDHILREVLHPFLPRILHDSLAGQRISSQFSPKLLVLDHLIQPSVIAGAFGLANRNVPSLMVNHGSDTAQAEDMAQRANKLWARHGRITAPGLRYLIAKSPATAELASSFPLSSPAKFAVTVSQKIDLVRQPPENPFLVVVAGNYREIGGHVPFATELPGEFQRGLIEFAEEAAQIDGLKLLIKMKPKKSGLSIEALRRFFQHPKFAGRVEIDTDTPLSDLFDAMHLLVGNNSATIFEAIEKRIPVFLNTWHRQYFHLPANLNGPVRGNRSAVYSVRDQAEIRPLLEAIKAEHQTRLTDHEVHGMTWSREDLDITRVFLSQVLAKADV